MPRADAIPKTTIPTQGYEELLRDQCMLQALHATGVDGWDGYEYAQEICETLLEERGLVDM